MGIVAPKRPGLNGGGEPDGSLRYATNFQNSRSFGICSSVFAKSSSLPGEYTFDSERMV